MAETSGFFDSTWDETAVNPETGQLGDWNPRYLVSQFNKYFALLVGNGVFASPVNQCKVIPGTGLSVIVSEGFAYINGMWYYNDSPKEIPLVPNQTGNNRVDSVRIRYSEADKIISASIFTGDTEIVRGESIYDLKIADIIVQPYMVEMSAANITDTRPNEDVCGFVKGLLEVVNTKDLFDQYTAIFNEWFDMVKDQVTGDLAIRLQQEFEEINQNFIDYKKDTQQMIADYKSDTDSLVEESRKIASDFVEKDFVIPLQTLVFVDKRCVITDTRITKDTLVDVYFTKETVHEAVQDVVYVNSYDGYIEFTAERQPTGSLEAVMRVRIF